MEQCEKIFCKCCGKWLGVKEKNADIQGVYIYCKSCKKQVPVTLDKIKK